MTCKQVWTFFKDFTDLRESLKVCLARSMQNKKKQTLPEICLNKQKFLPNLQHCAQMTAPDYIFEPAFVILHYNAFDSK